MSIPAFTLPHPDLLLHSQFHNQIKLFPPLFRCFHLLRSRDVVLSFCYLTVPLNSFIVLLLGNAHLRELLCLFSHCMLVIEVDLALDFSFLLFC